MRISSATDFRVGVTRDFLSPDGQTLAWGDIGLSAFEESPWIDWEYLAPHGMELTAADVAGYDALLVNEPAVGAAALAGNSRLALVARFGVGYDRVDITACTDQGVLVTNTPVGVRRPMASSVLCLLLALAHRLLDKDKITRAGRWDDRLATMGRGLTGATIGIVGFGNIGQETERLLLPFDARILVSDPRCAPGTVVSEHGARAVALPDLMRESEFVVVLAPLTERTRHLIGPNELELLGPNGYLISMSRGAVVDETALIAALKAGIVHGAALDVFESEPLDATSELVELDCVLLTPHALCWTDEMARGCGTSAIEAIIRVSRGETTLENVVNPRALLRPECVARLAEYAQARQSGDGPK